MKNWFRTHPFVFAVVLAVVLASAGIAALISGLHLSARAHENHVMTVHEPLATVELHAQPTDVPVPSSDPTDYKRYGNFTRMFPEDLQYPALTLSEQERCHDMLLAYEEGKRPQGAAPSDPAETGFAIMPLPKEQYDGLTRYVFLPARKLTDEELLQLIDYDAQRGGWFSPDSLNRSNCMRGGCIEVNRNRTEEEDERFRSLAGRYTHEGLRPQGSMASDPMRGSIATVALNAEVNSGLPSFTFYPLRRLTDEELLQLIDMGMRDSLYNQPGFSANWKDDEAKCRALAIRLFDMDASTAMVQDGYEPGDAVRPDTYMAYFETQKNEGRWWWYAVWIDRQSGVLLHAVTSAENDNLIRQLKTGETVRVSPDDGLNLPDVDLSNAKWRDAAKAYVSARLAEGRNIVAVKAFLECDYNAGSGVDVAVSMSDGSSYRIAVLRRNMEIISVESYPQGFDVEAYLRNRG